MGISLQPLVMKLRLPKIVFVLLLLTIGSAVVMAQSAGPTGGQITPRHRGFGAKRGKAGPLVILTQTMKLTKTQRKEFFSQMLNNRKQIAAYRKANPGDRQGTQALAQKLQAASDTAIQGMLTKSQYAIWTAWVKASKLKNFNADYRALRAAKVTKDEIKEIRKLKAKAHFQALMAIAKNPTNQKSVDKAKQDAIQSYKTGLAKILTSDQMQAYQSALGSPRG